QFAHMVTLTYTSLFRSLARALWRIRRLQDIVPRVRLHSRGSGGRRGALAAKLIRERTLAMTETTQNPNLAALSAAGVSVWLDDRSEEHTSELQSRFDLV